MKNVTGPGGASHPARFSWLVDRSLLGMTGGFHSFRVRRGGFHRNCTLLPPLIYHSCTARPRSLPDQTLHAPRPIARSFGGKIRLSIEPKGTPAYGKTSAERSCKIEMKIS